MPNFRYQGIKQSLTIIQKRMASTTSEREETLQGRLHEHYSGCCVGYRGRCGVRMVPQESSQDMKKH